MHTYTHMCTNKRRYTQKYTYHQDPSILHFYCSVLLSNFYFYVCGYFLYVFTPIQLKWKSISDFNCSSIANNSRHNIVTLPGCSVIIAKKKYHPDILIFIPTLTVRSSQIGFPIYFHFRHLFFHSPFALYQCVSHTMTVIVC